DRLAERIEVRLREVEAPQHRFERVGPGERVDAGRGIAVDRYFLRKLSARSRDVDIADDRPARIGVADGAGDRRLLGDQDDVVRPDTGLDAGVVAAIGDREVWNGVVVSR